MTPFIKYLFITLLFSCSSPNSKIQDPAKFNGVSLVASREKLEKEQLIPIQNIHANAVALMPYAFMQALDSPDLFFNSERQWWGERVEGVRHTIQILHADSLEVMIKPQIWLRHGDFTGDIDLKSEQDWQAFEKNYEEYITLYAQLAKEEKVEILCLGTELYLFARQRNTFWEKMISDIRKIYSGKITYAENWDKIDKISFWGDLDFIGVDAYYPLNEGKSPSPEELKLAWKPHKKLLFDLSTEFKKPVLFTEYGYRNVDFATRDPWNSSREIAHFNNQLQADALRVIYEEFWQENWFAGGFLWKWHQDHASAGGPENNQFTPQNKPAESVVKQYYNSGKISR